MIGTSSKQAVVAGIVGGCLFFASQSAAQDTLRPVPQAEAEAKPTPRTPGGKVDFSGFYSGFYTGISSAAADEQLTFRLEDGSVFFTYNGANDPQDKAEGLKPNQPP